MFSNISPVVKNLLIINIICFFGANIFDYSLRFFGVFYPDSPFFKIWQVITYMFMHGGFNHLFFNMFALFMFGSVIERVLGSRRFINFYFICGIGALILQYGVQAVEVYQITGTVRARELIDFDFLSNRITSQLNLSQNELSTLASIYATPLVGASGAIYGLLLAFAYLFPNMSLFLLFIPIPIKAKYFIPILIVIEIYLSFSSPGSSVAHLAHVGGALFGFLLLKIWGIKRGHI
ncbi:MAG TPA: rhomboid family intramembrane serine protease [Sphingobacterium sp.]|nr:rhomboid family intramembrane serine protease [Sphingobacterium sp.]